MANPKNQDDKPEDNGGETGDCQQSPFLPKVAVVKPKHPTNKSSRWSNFFLKIARLLPFFWPRRSKDLQVTAVVCFALVLAVRAVNVVIPMLTKQIVDTLSSKGDDGSTVFPWELITVSIVLQTCQGSQGLLNNLRMFLWIKVQQYASKEIQVSLFAHLHSLSLRWHLSRKTGEVLQVMERGTSSIQRLLDILVFNVIPSVLDIVIAIIYFAMMFNGWFGLIVAVTMSAYLFVTVAVTEWRTKFLRKLNLAENDQRTKAVDSLLNFETVKYFNAETFETQEFQRALSKYQSKEWSTLASLSVLQNCQSLVLNCGLLVGFLFCGYLIALKQSMTIGDYVLFGTYIAQLLVPLNFLGMQYMIIQESSVNMENMLDLLNEKVEIMDEFCAQDIIMKKGKIEFRNVGFSYNPERPILRNVSFVAESGKKIAFVGPTGSGKSTLIRLLFRFYDVGSGSITIDGQDISHVKQKSLRKLIGVVPQDTVLFNNTIEYNIRYGKPDANTESVKEAATLACIHQRILDFERGYETMVGERGLKLSGGEKQRIAIARTLLKAPKIVLLDEATSALDTQTEKIIQEALDNVCKERTTIMVAHRLSTVTSADTIFVLQDGEIVENGRHKELLAQGGLYFDMWNQQSSPTKDDDVTEPDAESHEDGDYGTS